MKLIKLQLINWGLYSEKTINFSDDGLTVEGKSKTGKSSIIKAITFVMAGRVDGSTKGHSPFIHGKSTSVTLEFIDNDGNTQTVSRNSKSISKYEGVPPKAIPCSYFLNMIPENFEVLFNPILLHDLDLKSKRKLILDSFDFDNTAFRKERFIEKFPDQDVSKYDLHDLDTQGSNLSKELKSLTETYNDSNSKSEQLNTMIIEKTELLNSLREQYPDLESDKKVGALKPEYKNLLQNAPQKKTTSNDLAKQEIALLEKELSMFLTPVEPTIVEFNTVKPVLNTLTLPSEPSKDLVDSLFAEATKAYNTYLGIQQNIPNICNTCPACTQHIPDALLVNAKQEAETKYNNDVNTALQAYQEYNTKYSNEAAKYEAALISYNTKVQDVNNKNIELKNQYNAAMELYDKSLSEYNIKLASHNDDIKKYNEAVTSIDSKKIEIQSQIKLKQADLIRPTESDEVFAERLKKYNQEVKNLEAIIKIKEAEEVIQEYQTSKDSILQELSDNNIFEKMNDLDDLIIFFGTKGVRIEEVEQNEAEISKILPEGYTISLTKFSKDGNPSGCFDIYNGDIPLAGFSGGEKIFVYASIASKLSKLDVVAIDDSGLWTEDFDTLAKQVITIKTI